MDGRGRGGRGRARGFRGGGRGRGRGGGPRGGRGWAGGGWRGGGRGRGRGRGRGDRGGRFGGRGGGYDFADRRPADPTPETLALMGKRAEESTVGITQFMTDDTSVVSGVLKQRYSDFIVREVAPDGELCKGTNFPGLLPTEKNAQEPSELAAASSDEQQQPPEAENGAEHEEDEAATQDRNGLTDEVKSTVKEGMQSLVTVLGEGLAAEDYVAIIAARNEAQLEAFILEGLAMNRKDTRRFVLPLTAKEKRTQVYKSLSDKLNKYVLAKTVVEPVTVMSGIQGDKGRRVGKEETKNGDATSNSATNGDADADAGEKSSKADEGKDGEEPGADANSTDEIVKSKLIEIQVNSNWRKKGNKRKRIDTRGESWPSDRPEYCRFVLYKENVDTMSAVGRICKHFRVPNKNVGYAGTKDKRGVTSQWCTVRWRAMEELQCYNRPLGGFQGPIVLVGNMSYVSEPLKLGSLSGNKFGIVLRKLSLPTSASSAGGSDPSSPSPSPSSLLSDAESKGKVEHKDGDGDTGKDRDKDAGGDKAIEAKVKTEAEVKTDAKVKTEAETEAEAAVREEAMLEEGKKLNEVISERCRVLTEKGFINYFGLQRFGSGGSPTSDVGMAMLMGDWEAAVKLIMKPRMGENEATHDSKVHFLKNPEDIQGTLNRLPFFMDAERKMMQALLNGGSKVYLQALRALPKNLQLMYLHAFQSLMWNLAASKRIEVYGRDKVVEGDLVFPKHLNMAEVDSILMEPKVEMTGLGETTDAADAAPSTAAERGDEEADAAPSTAAERGVEEADAADETENVDGTDGAEEPESREAKRARKTREGLPEVHLVTAQDIEQETFGIADVVLPMPGHGVIYPANSVRDCYTKALEERGLTEECYSSSSERAFTLGGMYRRLLQVPKDLTWEIKRYEDLTRHLVNTDIDDLLDGDSRLTAGKAETSKASDKVANGAAPAADSADPMDVEAKEDTVEAKGDTVEAKGDTVEVKEDTVEVKEDTVEVKEDTVEVKEDTVEAKEDTVEVKEDTVEAKEDTAATEKVTSKDVCKGRYHALCLNFTLPAAAYATMCLREVTRQDTSTSFHTSLSGPPAHRANSSSAPTEATESVSKDTEEVELDEDDGIPTLEKQVKVKEEAKKGSAIKVGTSLQR